MSCKEYELQIERAQDAVKTLEERLYKVRHNLDKNPEDAVYRRELKQLSLDMKITMNELEHAQSELELCRSSRKTTVLRKSVL
ncbi:hypothetical protein [Flavobacterium selenitireducens]|uniref:hypothetical protein n=1 Tax=Flavobacterium selenitireducens TaxID=2722704 RepID=UPI00168B3DA8|nr:hypothetical protein [Flavobacterium selenitireducens]